MSGKAMNLGSDRPEDLGGGPSAISPYIFRTSRLRSGFGSAAVLTDPL